MSLSFSLSLIYASQLLFNRGKKLSGHCCTMLSVHSFYNLKLDTLKFCNILVYIVFEQDICFGLAYEKSVAADKLKFR